MHRQVFKNCSHDNIFWGSVLSWLRFMPQSHFRGPLKVWLETLLRMRWWSVAKFSSSISWSLTRWSQRMVLVVWEIQEYGWAKTKPSSSTLLLLRISNGELWNLSFSDQLFECFVLLWKITESFSRNINHQIICKGTKNRFQSSVSFQLQILCVCHLSSWRNLSLFVRYNFSLFHFEIIVADASLEEIFVEFEGMLNMIRECTILFQFVFLCVSNE